MTPARPCVSSGKSTETMLSTWPSSAFSFAQYHLGPYPDSRGRRGGMKYSCPAACATMCDGETPMPNSRFGEVVIYLRVNALSDSDHCRVIFLIKLPSYRTLPLDSSAMSMGRQSLLCRS